MKRAGYFHHNYWWRLPTRQAIGKRIRLFCSSLLQQKNIRRLTNAEHLQHKATKYFKDQSFIHFLLLMRSVGCSGAAFHVRKRTFHAPMVRFMRQSRRLIYNLTIYHVQLMYYLVILCCRPLSDTRREIAENETDSGAESFLGPE